MEQVQQTYILFSINIKKYGENLLKSPFHLQNSIPLFYLEGVKMIKVDELFLVNYCHLSCKPFQNIMRLPKEEAFSLAYNMAADNPETTAFYRFADFEHYYPLRLKTDKILFDSFVSLGGKPKEKHPLSFVLQGSKYLDKWFDNGVITKLKLKDIPWESISFTYGDSSAIFDRNSTITVFTKEVLLCSIKEFDGTINEYMNGIEKKYSYIEAQLWDDKGLLTKSIIKNFTA